MSIDANGVVTNGMLARYDAGIKDIIAMRTAEKNPVRYKVVKSTSTGSQTYSFYKKDENDTQFVVDSASDAITVQDSIDSTSKDPVNGVAVAAAFATQMTTQNINSIIGYTPMDSSIKGAANGVASLDGLGQVPVSQLPVVDTYSATGTKPINGAGVAAALATLPEPMVFKGTVGTGGTVTSLPTAANSNKGHTYKAISDNIVSGSKIGDTFISTGSAWVTIPSGDEPSGTVTQVGINASSGSHLSASGTVTSSGTLTVGVESGYQIPSSSDVSQISTNKSNILYVADSIGKNLLNIENITGATNATYTSTKTSVTITSTGTYGNIRTKTHLKTGKYVWSCDVSNLSAYTGESPYITMYVESGGSDIAPMEITSNGNKVSTVFTISTEADYYFYIYARRAGSTDNTLTVSNLMLCTEEAWNISHEFEPYALPNYDLTRLEAEDRASLAEVVDSGAKNLFDLANATLTDISTTTHTKTASTLSVETTGVYGRVVTPLALKKGNYVFHVKISSYSPHTSANKAALAINSDTIGTDTAYGFVFVTANGEYTIDFTLTSDATVYIAFTANNTAYAVSPAESFVASEIMVCTKAAFGVSQKFVPYEWQCLGDCMNKQQAPTIFSSTDSSIMLYYNPRIHRCIAVFNVKIIQAMQSPMAYGLLVIPSGYDFMIPRGDVYEYFTDDSNAYTIRIGKNSENRVGAFRALSGTVPSGAEVLMQLEWTYI